MATFQFPVGIRTASFTAPRTSIYYPVVYGLRDQTVEAYLNRTIVQSVQALQQAQLKVQTGTNMEMTGRYEIKTNERGILSLMLTNYAYSYPMAHGFTIAKSLTFDVNTGQLYELHNLFQPGSNYQELLARLIAEQVNERDIPLLQGPPSVRPDQDYYLADKALVIFYQLYEISPYYVGFPMFPISIYEVQSIAAEPGPLSTLSADVV
ncbi:DUF3298 and DUF4163 domain-containing protein [Paenibacillus xerothermodurans]|uniref:DUF3298 domain-containing protein n=1 Tax=Paenibacillus xerothermodurans TaxID=1977292 RepID=A0A2W1P3D1_PAEXE|nr:DUF3298 and DUF4163 domain-containing protein [Paenibacillus xerothermodurans]PZE21678.1 DUF3298 domain-containing protein [Paenibacillus xerothermodurans]